MGWEEIRNSIEKATARPTVADVLSGKAQEKIDSVVSAVKPYLQVPPENGKRTLYEDPRIAEEAANKKPAGKPKSRYDEVTGR